MCRMNEFLHLGPLGPDAITSPRESLTRRIRPPEGDRPQGKPRGTRPPTARLYTGSKTPRSKGRTPPPHSTHRPLRSFGETTTASASHARDGAPHTPHTGKVEAPPHPTRTAAVKGLAFRSRSTQICEIARGEGGRREGGNRGLYSLLPAMLPARSSLRPSVARHTADVLSSPSHGWVPARLLAGPGRGRRGEHYTTNIHTSSPGSTRGTHTRSLRLQHTHARLMARLPAARTRGNLWRTKGCAFRSKYSA